MSSSKSSRNRQILVARIRIRGMIMAFRCVRCMNEKFNYIRSKDSSFYLLYIEKILSCEVEPFSRSNFIKIDKKRARLNSEEDRTNKEVRLYSSRINIILVKII
jgi:hypothetical protein